MIYYMALFFIGSAVMRGAGCVVNDILDRNIDALVERTKSRPLPSGRLNLYEALAFLFFLLTVGLIVFLMLNTKAELYSICAFGLALIYPLMKRFFLYPQLFLGVVFSSGAIIAWVGASGELSFSAFLLYAACILWTVGYDTIYGFQDIKNDKEIGVKSTAISFGKKPKLIIGSCFVLMFIFLSASLVFQRLDIGMFLITPAILHMIWLLNKTNLESPEDCMKSFKAIAFISGFLLFIGLYIARVMHG